MVDKKLIPPAVNAALWQYGSDISHQNKYHGPVHWLSLINPLTVEGEEVEITEKQVCAAAKRMNGCHLNNLENDNVI